MINVTVILNFPNTFVPEFLRVLNEKDWVNLRVLFCYETTETGIYDKKH